MPGQSKDDLAKALEALSAGAPEEHHDQPAAPTPTPSPKPSPKPVTRTPAPSAAAPEEKQPAPLPRARIANPESPAPEPSPSPLPQPAVPELKSRMARAESPLSPRAASAAAEAAMSPAPRQRPSMPQSSPPNPATLAPARAPHRPVSHKQLELRRTLIPLLLTVGTILPLGGVASILMGEDSLIGTSVALPIIMIVMGLLILGAAALTMSQVKHLVAQGVR